MPARKRCLGVDIGNSSVKIAELVTDKEGNITITKLIKEELNTLPTAPEEERRAEVISAIRRALKENKISTREAVFCIPGHAVIIRRIKIPKTTPERMKRIIQYEAREQIPFPPDISRLEFQAFEADTETGEVEVLMVAIRKDHLANYLATINRVPLKPIGIGVSSFALFNYYAFQYDTKQVSPEVTPPPEEKKKKSGFFQLPKLNLKSKKKTKKEPEPAEEKVPEEEPTPEEISYAEVKAYVNIGLSSFDLCIGRHERVSRFGFARSVPRAGMEITVSIQKRLGLTDYMEAEKIKREKTAIIAGESIESLSSRGINVEASEAATSAVDRIIADIRRSLDFYVSQPDGMMVDGISLSGGESHLPELTTYLEERLGIPVDLVTRIDSPKLRIDPGVSETDIVSFPIAIGLALQGLEASRVSIDFLPPDLKVVREFKSKRHLVGAMVGLLVLMIGLSSMGGNKYIQEFKERENLYKDILLRNEAQKKKADAIVKKREQLKEYFDKIAKAMPEKRDYWLEFMTEIQKQKPEDIWLELLVLDPNGNVRIMGRSESERSVAEFIKNLKESLKDKFEEEPKLFSYQTVYDDNLKRKVASFDIRAKCKDKKSVWQEEKPLVTPTTPRALRRPIEAIRARPIF